MRYRIGVPYDRTYSVTLSLLGPALFASALSGSASARADDTQDPWLGRDKMLHATISAGLGVGFYALSAPLVEPRPARAGIGFVAAFSVGAIKELVDMRGAGDASGRDLAWDAVGALTGVAVATLFDYAWHRIRERRSGASGTRLAESALQ